MGKHKVILLLSNETERFRQPVSKRSMEKLLRHTLNLAGAGTGTYEISVSLVDDPRMRSLNSEHRGYDRTTDVLSFPQFESMEDISPGPDGSNLIGDIVISLQTLNRRSELRKDDPRIEFAKQLIHGTLHLLGKDHRSRRERQFMRELEEAVIDTVSGLTV